MQTSQKPASILNNSKDVSTSAHETGATIQDRQDNYNGIHLMFIGYLLYCNAEGIEVSDQVHSTFINLSNLLRQPETTAAIKQVKTPEPETMTVSEYAKLKGYNGFNGNFASRMSRKAAKVHHSVDLTSLGVKKYPVSVLEQVFKQTF